MKTDPSIRTFPQQFFFVDQDQLIPKLLKQKWSIFRLWKYDISTKGRIQCNMHQMIYIRLIKKSNFIFVFSLPHPKEPKTQLEGYYVNNLK